MWVFVSFLKIIYDWNIKIKIHKNDKDSQKYNINLYYAYDIYLYELLIVNWCIYGDNFKTSTILVDKNFFLKQIYLKNSMTLKSKILTTNYLVIFNLNSRINTYNTILKYFTFYESSTVLQFLSSN